MVDREYIASQLKGIGFANSRINRAEISELENILLPDETIYECVNGYYEGGVALLVATDIRVLLIDKKPMGFLNVDDLRFDMIGDIDYSHRIIGAQININCGMRNLIFKSYNQPRLRKAIGHIQQRMSEIKKEQAQHANEQRNHLEEINHQLQIYLLAQQQHLEQQLSANQDVQLPKPSPKLADYLFAQRLLEDFQNRGIDPDNPRSEVPAASSPPKVDVEYVPLGRTDTQLIEEMAEEGRREVLGETKQAVTDPPVRPLQSSIQGGINDSYGFDLNPFKIAYAKLPYLLRSRRYRHQS